MTSLAKAIPFVTLPGVILEQIATFLDHPADLECAAKATKNAGRLWRVLREKEIRAIAFGKKMWEEHFGTIGVEPELPKVIYRIFNRKCPFSKEKLVKETHMLVLIPQNVNNTPLTLNNLRKFIQNPKKGHKTDFDLPQSPFFKEHGDKKVEKSEWVMMTKTAVTGTRIKGGGYPASANTGKIKTSKDQDAFIKQNAGYEVPKALDAAICLLTHHVVSGERLYHCGQYSLRIHSRCQDKQAYRMVVANFTDKGFYINAISYMGGEYNVGALRRFP